MGYLLISESVELKSCSFR